MVDGDIDRNVKRDLVICLQIHPVEAQIASITENYFIAISDGGSYGIINPREISAIH
jgi:hypothetical protein